MFWRLYTLIKAILSGRCTQEEYESRKKACEECPALIRNRAATYCGACGCPNWRLARLDTKLWFDNLECPLGKW